MVQHEFMRFIFHQLHQLPGFVDDGYTLAPSQDSRKKCSYFNVLFLLILMRYRNGIIRYEMRLIVQGHLLVQKVLEFLAFQLFIYSM